MKSSSFALPGRRYPINDLAHARNALSRVAQSGTPAEKHAVAAKVAHKYPTLAAHSDFIRKELHRKGHPGS
jgi:hypothetical protein